MKITDVVFLQQRKDGEWTTFTAIDPAYITATKYDCSVSWQSGVADAIRTDGIEENTPLRFEETVLSEGKLVKQYKEFSKWTIEKNDTLLFLDVKNSKPTYKES